MDATRSGHGVDSRGWVTDTMNRGCITTVKDANSRRFRRTCEATGRVEDLKIDVMDSVKSVEPIVARQWKAWDKREGCSETHGNRT